MLNNRAHFNARGEIFFGIFVVFVFTSCIGATLPDKIDSECKSLEDIFNPGKNRVCVVESVGLAGVPGFLDEINCSISVDIYVGVSVFVYNTKLFTALALRGYKYVEAPGGCFFEKTGIGSRDTWVRVWVVLYQGEQWIRATKLRDFLREKVRSMHNTRWESLKDDALARLLADLKEHLIKGERSKVICCMRLLQEMSLKEAGPSIPQGCV